MRGFINYFSFCHEAEIHQYYNIIVSYVHGKFTFAPFTLISLIHFPRRRLWSFLHPCKLSKTLNMKHWLSGCSSRAKISPKFTNSKSVRGGQSGFSGGEENTDTAKDLLVLPTTRKSKRKFKDPRGPKRPEGQLRLTATLDNGHPWDARLRQEAEEKHGTHTALFLILSTLTTLFRKYISHIETWHLLLAYYT